MSGIDSSGLHSLPPACPTEGETLLSASVSQPTMRTELVEKRTWRARTQAPGP